MLTVATGCRQPRAAVPRCPDDCPLVAELIAWVERRNCPPINIVLTRSEAANIPRPCDPAPPASVRLVSGRPAVNESSMGKSGRPLAVEFQHGYSAVA